MFNINCKGFHCLIFPLDRSNVPTISTFLVDHRIIKVKRSSSHNEVGIHLYSLSLNGSASSNPIQFQSFFESL